MTHRHITFQELLDKAAKGARPPTSAPLPVQKRDENEAQLRKALEQLEQANAVQRGFISVVSHEFRTTLAGIQGFSELLRDRDVGLAKTKEFATIINNDVRRLDAVIGDLLDLERMMVGQLPPDLQEVDLYAFLKELVTQIRKQTVSHAIQLKFASSLPLCAVDPEQLRQLVKHLLSNAMNYSPDGGQIVVSARFAEDTFHLAIQDQGVGIPPESLEEVFVPFRRLKSPQTRSVKGAGLGLSLARQIVLLHHGEIWVESLPEHGSTFHVALPWVDPATLEENQV